MPAQAAGREPVVCGPGAGEVFDLGRSTLRVLLSGRASQDLLSVLKAGTMTDSAMEELAAHHGLRLLGAYPSAY